MLCSRFRRWRNVGCIEESSYEVCLEAAGDNDNDTHEDGEILHVFIVTSDEVPITNYILTTHRLQLTHLIH